MKNITEIEISNKRVLIRCDLDVPLSKGSASLVVAEDTRLKCALETIIYAKSQGAKIIICGHLGRPKGKRVPEMSLAPVKDYFESKLGVKLLFIEDVFAEDSLGKVNSMKSGDVCLLENIRYYPQEESDGSDLSDVLSSFADVYVNDAFATSHRAHASVFGAAKKIPTKVAGLTLKREMDYFDKAFKNPERPLAVIFGGAKVSTKLAAITNVSKFADKIFVGGAMANTFFAAQGHNVGKSLYEPDLLDTAKTILANPSCKLVLPVDVVLAKEFAANADSREALVEDIQNDEMALDIGSKSLEYFKLELSGVNTIVWNGPMGAFETPGFEIGTMGLINLIASSSALSVVGGGDTDAALHMAGAEDKMSYVSTAGGAFLELLEGKKLPAIEALQE